MGWHLNPSHFVTFLCKNNDVKMCCAIDLGLVSLCSQMLLSPLAATMRYKERRYCFLNYAMTTTSPERAH